MGPIITFCILVTASLRCKFEYCYSGLSGNVLLCWGVSSIQSNVEHVVQNHF